MGQTQASTSPQGNAGAYRVAAPKLGDRLSGALHRAFDGQPTMPHDFVDLLAALDHMPSRPH